MHRIDDGSPLPMGATFDGKGVNFALFSEHATRVELCLFEPSGKREIARMTLPCRTEDVWHVYVEGLTPGQLYGYRVYGPYEPQHGHRFNHHKLLIDPYARQLAGKLRWHDSLFGYRVGSPRADLSFDRHDSGRVVPKSVVEDIAHSWGEDRRPRRRWQDTVIYEAHVKGLTELHPSVPQAMRGSYEALGHPALIEHFVKLGITAVELLPIHAFLDDRFLVDKGLKNYWGYSTIGFFAPEPRYMGPSGANGLRAAIRSLHDAGIEVLLDVVYNHTAEGNQMGPTLSFRGIDNASYYKLSPENQRYCYDTTGTGNTVNVAHPRVLQMVMDSLRYWVEAYHVDGFRFDLATTLARSPYDFSLASGFLQAVRQDPVLSRVKLIAEPWDVGDGGYRVGGFPKGWSEWNDQVRDPVRSFWKSDPGQKPAIAHALAGSADIYRASGRHPWASVNYVSSHDGYTLHDVVSYNERHNHANGEDNRDGHSHNLSWNCGAEGPTDDANINALRARQKRNMLATIFLSQGVPMLLMGDELSRSQNGNNNAYAQDNETSWMDWKAGARTDPDLLEFVRSLIRIRRRYDAFRRRTFFDGAAHHENGLEDVYWLAPNGREMSDDDWHDDGCHCFGMQFGNDAQDGQRFLILMNSAPDSIDFYLPPDFPGEMWVSILETGLPRGTVRDEPAILENGQSITLQGRTLVLLQHAFRAQEGN